MANCYINTSPFFIPQRMFITAINRGDPTTVTTSIDHNFETGFSVLFFLPRKCNMQQLHHKVSTITVTGNDTFTIPIDSSSFDAFVNPPDPFTCGQVVPIEEVFFNQKRRL